MQLANCFSPGSLIDSRYEVQELLGAGGMAWVLLAKDLSLNSLPVAVKLVYPQLVSSDNMFVRFRNEISLSRKLSHPNIVQTFGSGLTAIGLPYAVMEYVCGVTMKSLIAAGEVSNDQIEDMLVQLADALSFAHARGVIHRDIKPDNVMVTEEGALKAADFGLAQLFRESSRMTKAGNIVGTPTYMSPEQIRGEALSPLSDVYSFGIVAYELAAGSAPFQAETFYGLAEQHLHAPLPPLSPGCGRPGWLADFIGRCAEKEPEKRFASMADALNCLLQHTGRNTSSVLPVAVQTVPAETPLNTAHWAVAYSRYAAAVVQRRPVLTFLFLLLIATVIASHRNARFNQWIATVCYWTEHRFGIEPKPVKWLYNIKRKYGPEALFALNLYTNNAVIAAGMDPNTRDELGRTLLHCHAELKYHLAGPFRRLQETIRMGADVNARTLYSGRTPLLIAVFNHNYEMAKFFLEAGANPNLAAKNGMTPLGAALYRIKGAAADPAATSLIAVLLEHKADANAKLPDGSTPLHHAAAYFESGQIDLLLKHGADPNQRDAYGRTPLMTLLQMNHSVPAEPAVRLLAEASDLTLRDSAGKDVLTQAEEIGFEPAIPILRAAIAQRKPGQ